MTNVAQEMFEYRGGIFKKSSLGTGGSSNHSSVNLKWHGQICVLVGL